MTYSASKLLLFSYVFTLCVFLASCGTSPDASLPPHRQGEVLVKFRSTAKSTAKTIAHLNARIASNLPHSIHRLSLPTGKSVSEALSELRGNPDVLYAEPNYLAHKSQLPNDPRYSEQWGLTAISAPQAWDIATGNAAIIVATLDTGIDYRHPDLVDNVWVNSKEIAGNGLDDDGNGIIDDVYGIAINGGVITGNPMDDDTADTHGTHVAGIIGAVGNNTVGISGINWQVKLMAIKFLHGPLGEGDLADAVTGMSYAVEHGAKIINCSFEIPGSSQTLSDAIAAAENNGVLIVSAAGNSGSNIDKNVVVPASIRTDNNIAVAATTQDDTIPSWSNYGQRTVDLAAPGGMNTGDPTGILSTVTLFDKNTKQFLRYRTTAGTSMAAPHVSGVAALVWGKFPELSYRQVRARIMNGADKLTNLKSSTLTGGRLNAYGALTAGELPAIFSVTPAIPSRGDTITIHGTNFGSGASPLTCDDALISPVSWHDTAITAVIPQSATNCTLRVNHDGGGFPLDIALKPLTASLTASPQDGVAPFTTILNASVVSPEAPLTLIEWDLGDGLFVQQADNSLATVYEKSFSEPGMFSVRVRATDQLGRSVVSSSTVTVTAPPASASDSRCFIATAAYGTPLHPRVASLRKFRDRYLLTNAPGSYLVDWYYKISPPLAHIIASHATLRTATRLILQPLVWGVELII